MKTNLLIAFLLACTTILFGCGSRQEDAISSLPSTAPSPTPSVTAVPAQVTDSQNNLKFTNSAKGAETEEGFYSISYYDDWSGCLIFYDYKTTQAAPVCNEVNCEHHSETCTAWFGDANNIPRIVSNSKQLIYCYLGLSGQTQKPAWIETANLDGTDRHVLYEFAANETLYEGFCVDQQYIYALVTRVLEESLQTQQSLERIDLSSGNCDVLWSADVPAGTAYFLAGSINHQPIIKEISQPNLQVDDDRAIIAAQTHTLISVNPKDGTLTELYSWQQNDGLEAPLSDTLYYITKDHFLCTFSSDNAFIKVAQNELFEPTTTRIQYTDGSQLWFTSTSGSSAQNNSSSSLYQLNLGNKQVSFCPLSQTGVLQILGGCSNKLLAMTTSDYSINSAQSQTYFMVDKDQLTLPSDEMQVEYFSYIS